MKDFRISFKRIEPTKQFGNDTIEFEAIVSDTDDVEKILNSWKNLANKIVETNSAKISNEKLSQTVTDGPKKGKFSKTPVKKVEEDLEKELTIEESEFV